MSGPTSGLAHLFRQLKTTAAARALPKLADRARAEEWSYEQLAAALLKTETDSRDSHGGRARIKAARFPARKTIEELDFAFQSSLPKNIILHLGQLDFLAGKETRRARLRLALRGRLRTARCDHPEGGHFSPGATGSVFKRP